MKCLQRCELQTESLMTTFSRYPNAETFPFRREVCLVLQKISRICTNSLRKKVFQSKMMSKNVTCEEVLTANNTDNLCNADYLANSEKFYRYKQLLDFLLNYAKENLSVLNIYFRDPYYTKFVKDENIPVISFIGNAGGLLGLCLGMSFVSIFELFYHFILSFN